MMNLVALLESAQNRYSVLYARFTYHHWLKAALKGSIFLNVFPVLIQSGGTDCAQLTSGKLRLQKIRGVHRSLGCTSSDNGVELINEKNDLSLA